VSRAERRRPSTIEYMTASWDICIRGGGIVGRTLALLLAQQANRVALVERPGGPGPDVRAYALNETSRQLLSQMGCWPPPAQATPVQSMQVWGDAGGHVRFDAPGPLGLTTIVDVPALESLLDQALTQRPQVTRVSEPVSASLTVISEGRHSTTRAELGIDVERVPYQQYALACRVQTEHPHRQQALQWFRQEGATPEILALLPLNGPAGSQSAVIWSTSPERAQQLLALSETDFVFQLQAASYGYLGQLACSSARAVWPLQLTRAQTWCGEWSPGQAWVLAGDAAHAIHPLAGQGLNLGLADAQALSEVLQARRGGIDYWRSLSDRHLLRRYERSRKADMLPTWLACDGLQRLFSHPNPTVQSLRNWGLSSFDRLGAVKRWTMQNAMRGH
jgi:2-polyprenyl-6-methoxyphenol hydroxylase-like FAD-dependent oxidoreductase